MIALFVTLCLHAITCREIHLIQETGPFASQQDCIANGNKAVERWIDAARPVLGSGYELSNPHCGVWTPPEGDAD